MIKDKNPDDSTGVASLNEALEQWILQNYNTKKHGLPSWKTLLKAVSLVDQSTFEKLAKEHQLEGIIQHRREDLNILVYVHFFVATAAHIINK